MKKYSVSIQKIPLDVTGARYGGRVVFNSVNNIVELNVPPNMVVNRVTFQLPGEDAGGASFTAALINVRPPNDGYDGVILATPFIDPNNAIYGPDKYTFENFNGEEICNTFYVANLWTNPNSITVIYEGYER